MIKILKCFQIYYHQCKNLLFLPLKTLCLWRVLNGIGSHLGEFKTPAKETDDVKKNHFYHYQQNLLESVAKKNNFSWIAIRPHTLCINVIGFPMNLALIISIYASICKYKKLKFTFPGNLQNWNSVYQVTSAKILSDAIYCLLNNDKCKNNAFNLTKW